MRVPISGTDILAGLANLWLCVKLLHFNYSYTNEKRRGFLLEKNSHLLRGFRPRALLKGPKRSFIVLVLVGVESRYKMLVNKICSKSNKKCYRKRSSAHSRNHELSMCCDQTN